VAPELVLPPRPSSVAAARHFVAGVLDGWERRDLVDDASVITSELVTNAVLHAGTSLRVVLSRDDCVRIAVHDHSPVMPVVKASSDRATTGRGLHLVQRLADSWGVETNAGKAVWCRLCSSASTGGTASSDAPMEVDLEAWLSLDADVAGGPGREGSPAEPDTRVDVWLLRLPLDVYRRSQEHSDDLGRELRLIASAPEEAHSVPRRLRRLIYELADRYVGANPEAQRRLQEALERGEATVDVRYRMPPRAAEDVVALGELLREADEYCRAGGGLLTLATPPEALRFREWVFGEIRRQIGGGPPRPWPGDRPVDP
jgi:anti-sigma regulatory factor (Ser/Thr protein kinase)